MNNDASPKMKEPYGLSGWFVIIILGLFWTIILGINELMNYSDIWKFVDFGYGVFFAISSFNSIFISAIILVSIFKKDIRFRAMFVIQSCVYMLMAFIMCGVIKVNEQVIVSIIGRVLWSIYLFKSERVKNTFENSYPLGEIRDE